MMFGLETDMFKFFSSHFLSVILNVLKETIKTIAFAFSKKIWKIESILSLLLSQRIVGIYLLFFNGFENSVTNRKHVHWCRKANKVLSLRQVYCPRSLCLNFSITFLRVIFNLTADGDDFCCPWSWCAVSL